MKQGSGLGHGENKAFLDAFLFRVVTGNGNGDCFDLRGPATFPVLDMLLKVGFSAQKEGGLVLQEFPVCLLFSIS